MRKRTVIILTIIGLLILGLVFLYNELKSLNDFTVSSGVIDKELKHHTELVKFGIVENAIYPHAMDLTMTGKINGTGILSFGWNDTAFYKIDTISSEFLVEFNHGDWYSDSCLIQYEPLSATAGQLKIDYKIYASKK